MDFEKLCTKVSEVDPHVRFTGILDSKGELIIQKNREDVTLLNEEEVKMSVHYTFERWTRLQNLSYKFGKEKLSVTEYENVTLISIQLSKNLFLLSTDPNIDHMSIISKAKAVIAEL